MKFSSNVLWLAALGGALGLAPRAGSAARRDFLRAAAATSAALAPAAAGASALLPNALPEAAKYTDRPRQRSKPAADLGLRPRAALDADGDVVSDGAPALKACAKPSPNCFSTTPDALGAPGAPRALAPWAPPAGASRADAWRAVVAAVEAYPPGQGGIDGGGFKIVEADAARGYLYAQFESLKNGYVDDLELALVGPSGPLLVRSASRLGFLDFGVNARRLNWIAARLRADGWKAPPIDAATWPDYFAQNRDRP